MRFAVLPTCFCSFFSFPFFFFFLCNLFRTHGLPLAMQAALVVAERSGWQGSEARATRAAPSTLPLRLSSLEQKCHHQGQENPDSGTRAASPPAPREPLSLPWARKGVGVVLQGGSPAFSAPALALCPLCFSILFSISFISALLFFF